MAYEAKYIADWENPQGNLCRLVFELFGYEGPQIAVKPAATACTMVWDSNAKDKLEPIRASYLDINIQAEGQFQLTDFLKDDPLAWRVRLFYDNKMIWAGFIAADDVQEPLLDPPYVVNLRAIDGLGLLKDIPFIKESEAGCFNLERVTVNTTLNRCIRQVNDALGLQVRTWVNIFANEMVTRATDPAANPMWQTTIFWESFRENESSYMSCYDVLAEVLNSWGATIVQAWGRWHIQRITERIGKPGTSDTYYTDYQPQAGTDALGTDFIVGFGLKGYEHEIKVNTGEYSPNNDSAWASVDQILFNERAAGSYKVTYNFNTFDEIPSNPNWDRSTPLGVGLEYDPTIDIEAGVNYKFSRPNCWNLVTTQIVPGFPLPGAKRVDTVVNQPWYLMDESDDFGNAIERYIGIIDDGFDNLLSTVRRVVSGPVLVNKNDRITFSVDRRETSEGSQDLNIHVADIYIDGNDGKTYTYIGNGEWATNPNASSLFLDYTAAESKQAWRSCSTDQPAIVPVDGVLKIYLFNINNVPGASVQFKNFQLDVETFIGNNVRPSLLQSTTTPTPNNPVTLDKETFLSESAKDSVAGNIYRATTNLQRFSGWKRYGIAGELNYKFQEQLLIALAQTKRFTFRSVTGTVYGTQTNTGEGALPLSPLNIFTAANIPNSYFMVDSLSVDLSTDTATATFLELWRVGVGTGADYRPETIETKILSK